MKASGAMCNDHFRCGRARQHVWISALIMRGSTCDHAEAVGGAGWAAHVRVGREYAVAQAVGGKAPMINLRRASASVPRLVIKIELVEVLTNSEAYPTFE